MYGKRWKSKEGGEINGVGLEFISVVGLKTREGGEKKVGPRSVESLRPIG